MKKPSIIKKTKFAHNIYLMSLNKHHLFQFANPRCWLSNTLLLKLNLNDLSYSLSVTVFVEHGAKWK